MNKKTLFWVWLGGIYISLLLLSIAISDYTISLYPLSFHQANPGKEDWDWGLALFLSLVLYTITSVRKLGPTEQGSRVFFGRPVDQVSSGFVIVPNGLFELKIFPSKITIMQKEFPAEPEKIYRSKDGDHEIIPPEMIQLGMKPPIRIPFGKPGEQESSVLDRDPLNQRLIEEVVPIVRWSVDDCILFMQTVETIEKAESQMEDLCVAILSREFGVATPSQVIADLRTYNNTLTTELQTGVARWGISIESAKIKVINFSYNLNKAVQKIAEETAKGKARTIEAEGLKQAAIRAGEGAGAAEKAVLKGRTDGLEDMMNRLDVKGPAVLAAETARGITNNPGQKTIIAGSSGFADLAAIGTILGEALAKGKEAKNET